MNSERAIANRLTIAYVAGLTFIAVLSGVVHILLDSVIEQQRDAATVINIAGRQRMLSQRIALLASDLHAGDESARPVLLKATELMRRSEDALVHGGDLGISGQLSPAARRYYFAGATPLDPAVRVFINAARRFADPVSADRPEDAYRLVQADAHSLLLPALNQAVTIFEGEANERVAWLRTSQKVVLGSLLVTLLLEATLIFRPLVVKVRRYAAHLYDMATRDGLTGLANRRHFMETAGRDLLQARRSGKPLTAVILDLDHFKQVNDTHGHAVGDAVLRRFAEVAARALRRTDVVGRIGGEEFAVVLAQTDVAEAMALAEKLRGAVADDRTAGLPRCTISVGVSVLDPADRSIDDLLRRADQALYRAKHEGRNRVAFQSVGDDTAGAALQTA